MYKVDVYHEYNLISTIYVDGSDVSFKNYSEDTIFLPFGVKKSVSYRDLLEFYEERCFPRERSNCKTVLKSIGLDYYDPELICRKTHGQQFDDFVWLQFSDEPRVDYDSIRLR